MSDCKLVPVEPTSEMLAAGEYALEAGWDASGIYADMLAAAPDVQGEPAEQHPIPPSLAYDATRHLTKWLNMNLCECEGGHTCGYNEVQRTRDALLAVAEQKPECGCCGQTDRCDDDCDAVVIGGHRAAPQPAEQQPAPDVAGLTEALRQYQHSDGSGLVFGYDRLLVDQYVAGLVEALECALSGRPLDTEFWDRCEQFIAAHRKQGGGQ